MIPIFLAALLYKVSLPAAVVVGVVDFVLVVFVGLGFLFYAYALVDREVGPIDALKESWNLTSESRLSLLVFLIVLGLLNLLGLLLLGVGLLATIPISMIAFAHVYRALENNRSSLPSTVEPEVLPATTG